MRKIYLVGGAVRDKFLGLTIKERDWVVVGARPEELLAENYQQVGQAFPVFIHPTTKEEYALARKEKKSAPGYYGFDCDFSPTVTLEEDLARRDLTINAMAMDDNGLIVDPYQGQRDLRLKILRHVSPAFEEDPVRVLRVARFAARFHSLGFTLANETRQLMYSMVKKGELAHLVPERVWQEWQRSLEEKNPEQFILVLRSCDALSVVLPEIQALFGVPNPVKYHKEVDSGIHSLMVLSQAVRLSSDPILRFAALVHDLGKAISPMEHWPRHRGHELVGVDIINTLCDRLRIPKDYRHLACMVSRYHLDIHRLMELRSTTIVRILDNTDAFRRPHLFAKLLLAAEADARGCGSEIEYYLADKWLYLLSECSKVDLSPLFLPFVTKTRIKDRIRSVRSKHIDSLTWKNHEK